MTQLLYGDHFKVLESRKHFSRIRIAYDATEGWVDNNQIALVDESTYHEIDTLSAAFSNDLVAAVTNAKNALIPVLLGATVSNAPLLGHTFEGNVVSSRQAKPELLKTAMYYLDAPYLFGGKTPFGIDASGFTQMIYKINGYSLSRSAAQQATQGDALSFIEESEAGDLAFFDNSEGAIDHVGIIMEDNYIIHVNGKVRIDRIDHTGIFNAERGIYSHQLRVIKKLI